MGSGGTNLRAGVKGHQGGPARGSLKILGKAAVAPGLALSSPLAQRGRTEVFFTGDG